MVGGPFHGQWRQVDPELIGYRGIVSIPHMRNPVYEEAPEFGVPRPLDDARYYDQYQLRTFDLVSPTYGEGLYIKPLVWLGMPWVEMSAIVGDAFHAACNPDYVPAWTMPRKRPRV